MTDNTMERHIHHAIDDYFADMDHRPSLSYKVLAQVRGEMNVKKKLSVGFVFLLILILLTVTALAVGVFGKVFQLRQDDVGSIRSCVSSGETLYLMTSQGLQEWSLEAENTTIILSTQQMNEAHVSVQSLLYICEETLGLIDTDDKQLWHYDDGKLSHQLSYEGTVMDLQDVRYTDALYQDGFVFVQGYRSAQDADEHFVFQIHLATGEISPFPIQNVYEMCNYEDGKILLLLHDESREDHLVLWDIKTQTLTETLYTAPLLQVQGIAYQKQQGLYALIKGELSHFDGTDWTSLYGHASGFLVESFAIVQQGYVTVGYDEMQYLPFVLENPLPTLTIRGYLSGDQTDKTFQETHGVSVVRNIEPTLTASDVKEAILSGDTTDLFHLRLEGDLWTMMKEGIVAPLGMSDVLTTDVSSMIPVVRDALLFDGIPYAVPSWLNALAWGATEDIPTTYTQLLQDKEQFHLEGDNEQYVKVLLETFVAQRNQQGKAISFSDDVFAYALEMLKDRLLSPASTNDTQIIINPYETIDLSGSLPADLPQTGEINLDDQMEYEDHITWQYPPKVDPSADFSISVSMFVYVLNPNAQNPSLAISYLEEFALHRDGSREGLFKPDQAIPMVNPNAQIDVDTPYIAPYLWDITKERLEKYQNDIVPYLEVRLHPFFSHSARQPGCIYEQLMDQMIDYIEGTGTLDECLMHLQNIWNHEYL